jgi:hypothetical protein
MRVSTKFTLPLAALLFVLLPGTGWATTTKNWTIAALGASTPASTPDSGGTVTHQRPLKHLVGRPEAAPESGGTVNLVYFFDDFENGLSQWTESTGFWGQITSDYRSTANSVSASPAGNYPENVNASLTLADSYELNLSGATSPILTFWHKYSIASYSGCCYWSAWDYGYVEYSTNYGVTWTKLSNQDTPKPDGNGPGFIGTVSSWTQEQFDLTQITNWQTLPIMIRFLLGSTGYTPKSWGWLIDEPELYDPATGKIYFGPDTFSPGSLPDFSNVTLTATPNAGYAFESWTGCNSTSGNECTINRYIDRVVTANFSPNPGLLKVSPSRLTFSKQPVNTTSEAKSVTATNPAGNPTIYFTSIATTPTSNFNISNNTCGASIAAGKKCKVSVTYTATALSTQSGTLTFTDSAINSPQTVTLTGAGEAQATLTPSKVTFPKTKVGTTSAAKVFTLTNNLSTTLTGISPSITGDFKISNSTCQATLAAKSSCTIDVTFTPTVTDLRTGTLTVNDSANSPQTAHLSGTGD